MENTQDDFELNPDADIRMDLTKLTRELWKQPVIMFRYAQLKSEAEVKYEMCKAAVEELESAKYIQIKSGGEKITEAHTKAFIDSDVDVRQARNRVYEAKRDMETYKNLVEALRHKKDMLIQLCVDARKE